MVDLFSFFLLIVWHWIGIEPLSPDYLYLIGFQSMTLVATVEPMAQLVLNKQLRLILIIPIIRPHQQRSLTFSSNASITH